ncbi:hypothetical protein B0G69_2148 [Paraburkholderia sp. RAU2J]|uniref:hypothetical protein n=1 Tax=Paraburkholderia sp. RAU2J TaxID=1938810 RepID=UPI000EB1B100|nr:hypothetical protein [Paraburkholderia sp. RAU2J]RKT26403.1 hypothetical protein B0G69_2148 [Paraburkholderia sp. RAU2J]
MSEPTIKKATKKAFHFPKAADSTTAVEDEAVAAAPKVSAPKKAATVKKSSKTKPSATAKTKPSATVKTKPSKANAEVKAKRAKKDKVVRDSFTMPQSDYEKIAALKLKCLAAGVSIKKSELLRAGLLMLESAAPKRLLAAVSAVEQVKTGRPAKS